MRSPARARRTCTGPLTDLTLRARRRPRPPAIAGADGRAAGGQRHASGLCYAPGMAEGPTPHELSERIARLEERMKTMQADYKTDIARLAEDNAKRETRLIVTIAGLIVAAVAILGVLIRWPA